MLRRLIIISLVFITALFLMFIKNKVLVGDQELQATVQAVPAAAGAKPDAPRVFTLALTDLAGNGVAFTASEVERLKERLAGNAKQEPIKTVGDPVITPDKTVQLTVPADVNEMALRSRIQGAPFKRANEPRDLWQLNYGIDIRGGVEFVCQLRNANGVRVSADDEVMAVLRERLDTRGLTEPVVTKLSNGDIQVVIPGGSKADAARTRKVLEDTGRLEFREVLDFYGYAERANAKYRGTKPGDPDCAVVLKANGMYGFAPGVPHQRNEIVAAERTDPGMEPTVWYRLGKAELTGSDVKDASPDFQDGQKVVHIRFTSVGAARNNAFTNRLFDTGPKGKDLGTGCLGILYDGVVYSAPIVQSPSGESCVITGKFTDDELNRLKTALKAGSLSVTPEVISERVVGATLGAESVTKAMWAMLASFALIAVFMWVYYGRHLGTVANLCLLLTAGIIYATLAVFDATLTLPGLAGLVLIIGMAVDTNILVFERIREEQAENKGMLYAIEHGYGRAFWTIVDAHLTTFATALVLYIVGSGPIRGFGMTLMIGIIINLFSGIYAGRLFTDWLCRRSERVSMASWVPALRLPYVEWRWFGYVLSIVSGIGGMLYFAFGHHLTGRSFESKFDIDFTGGNMVQVIFKEPRGMDQVQKTIADAYAKAAKELDLLDPSDLRMQAYYPVIGQSGPSRQWVFRGRDEQGSRLERERDQLENERVGLLRKADKLREENKDADAKALDKQVEPLRVKIQDLQGRIAARTEEFKRQISQAFPGQITPEGGEILEASWKDAVLTLHVATIEVPDASQRENLRRLLSGRSELAALEVQAPAAGVPGVALTATYRQKPAVSSRLEAKEDALVAALFERFTKAGATAELANGQTKVALDLYAALSAQAAKERLTVARSFPSSEHFSGQVAGQMKTRALLAVLISLVAILAYVAARFEFRFGVGAVLSLFHDIILTAGLITLVGIRIDLTVIAAILTIIGYSINDTVVTFDRIRENLRKKHGTLAETIDISIAQTMARTALTSGTTMATVAILLVWGGDSLFGFNATLLMGLVLGTYSSIFVAAPILMAFAKDGELTLVESTSDEDAGKKAVEAASTTDNAG